MIGRTNAVIGKSGGKWPSADDVQVTYTGTMKDPREITDAAGNKYILYELTSSGTLTVDKTVPADICFVSGGSGGCDNSGYRAQLAGVGGKGGQLKNVLICLQSAETYEITIGGGGEVDNSYNGNGGETEIVLKTDNVEIYSLLARCNGTCGGWSYGARTDTPAYMTADGLPKYVFGDSSVYSYPICAGGGGGTYVGKSRNAPASEPWKLYQGTDGGSNGSAETIPVGEPVEVGSGSDYTGDIPLSNGGNYGGGKSSGRIGGTVIDAEDGYAYGCGGGGQASFYSGSGSVNEVGSAGVGFQGVVFIRILK